jgi:TolB-like protein
VDSAASAESADHHRRAAFDYLSTDSADDYFADGLTDEIIRNLSIIDGLAPRSRSSSFVFKGKARDVREAGRLLDAEYLLEGSVLREGQHLRINVQLVRARDDSPVWSNRFDREMTGIVAVQDEISRGIVNSLRLKLGQGRRRYETSAVAYDLYLRARTLPNKDAIPVYEQASPRTRRLRPHTPAWRHRTRSEPGSRRTISIVPMP